VAVRRRWFAGSLLVAAGLGLLVAAGAATNGRAAAQQRGGTLQLTLPVGFSSLDPSVAGTRAIFTATQLLLVSYPDVESPTSNRLVPQAAVALPRVSPDGRTYTFTIRSGLRFCDGRPVTAANFAFSLNRVLRPELGAQISAFLHDIFGAEDVLAGRATVASGIRARGRTLTIRLTRPVPDFPSRMAIGNFGALPLDLPFEELTRAPVVSAGPYYIKEYVPRRSALLARNPYWNRRAIPGRPANVDAVAYTFGLSADEALARVERGELDYTGPPRNAIRDLHARFGVNRSRLYVRPSPTVRYLEFNHARPLFRRNVRLRRAVNFAVDRAYLARQSPLLALRRTDQILPPAMPGFAEAALYPLAGADVKRARELARGALRSRRAMIYAQEVDRQLAEIVRFNLAQIGIEATVQVFELPVFLERMTQRGEPWDVAVSGWFADYVDPANFFEPFNGRGALAGDLDVAFREPAWTRRIAEASALTGEARYAAFAALDRDLMREAAPVAPLFVENIVGFTSARLGCVNYHPYGFLDYAAVCLR
jgi:peptide/nickel transport system substrate-binding protein